MRGRAGAFTGGSWRQRGGASKSFTHRFAFRESALLQNQPADVSRYGWPFLALLKNAISPNARIEISTVAKIVKNTAANLAVTAFIR